MMPERTRQRRATINDVAAVSGRSRGTVSRVINGEPYVSPDAREAVETAIAKVGYVRNAAARNLVTRRSNAIALIVHEPHALFLEDPNIGAILLGTNSVLSEADYQLVSLIIDSNRDSQRVIDYLRGGVVDGAIIISARAGDPIALAVSELGLPAVSVGHPPGLPDMAFVGIDNFAAAKAITEKLVSTGRRSIGMIVSGLDRDSGMERLAGYRAAMGAGFDDDLVVQRPLYSYQSGVEGMHELLTRNPDIDGVFAASDAIAAGAIDMLQETGRQVPQDVGVVGFDDSSWATRCRPALSTVHQPATELGRLSARQVLEQLNGSNVQTGGTILETRIVWRASA